MGRESEDRGRELSSAIVTLDRAMRVGGHLWAYSSAPDGSTVIVVNRADDPDVPTRWEGFPVRQARMAEFSFRGRMS